MRAAVPKSNTISRNAPSPLSIHNKSSTSFLGTMASPCPWNRGHTQTMFYNPRSDGQSYESKLMESQYVWKTKELEKKYFKGQLPDKWMTEITSQKMQQAQMESQHNTIVGVQQTRETSQSIQGNKVNRVIFGNDSSTEVSRYQSN